MTPEDFARIALEEAERLSVKKCLWPAPYNDNTPEALYRFLTERVITWDDETGLENLVPALPFVRVLAESFWYSRETGKPLIIEKSRRLLASWILRGCELWSMGQKTETRVIAGLTYPKAAEHVWRIAFIFRKLKSETPWRLKDCFTRGGNFSAHEIDQVMLPNGSLVSALNQQSATYQGSGYGGVSLEEFSRYDRPGSMWAQSLIVTGGRADVIGGHVVAVTNAYPNTEWKAIKKPKEVLWTQDESWDPFSGVVSP